MSAKTCSIKIDRSGYRCRFPLGSGFVFFHAWISFVQCGFCSQVRLPVDHAALLIWVEIGSGSAPQLSFSKIFDREDGTTETSRVASRGSREEQPLSARLHSDWTESRPRGRCSGSCLFLLCAGANINSLVSLLLHISLSLIMSFPSSLLVPIYHPLEPFSRLRHGAQSRHGLPLCEEYGTLWQWNRHV